MRNTATSIDTLSFIGVVFYLTDGIKKKGTILKGLPELSGLGIERSHVFIRGRRINNER
jgi:hypothetical protein